MSWYIDSNTNNGYPFYDDFPSEFQLDFYSNGDSIIFPPNGWRIDPNYNSGYPIIGYFPERFNTEFYSDRVIKLPESAWRIKPGTLIISVPNAGSYYTDYPWTGFWSEEDTSTGGSEMVIGGSQTNYPNGFTSCNRGGILGQFDKKSMKTDGTGGLMVRNALDSALANRQFILDGDDMSGVLHQLNTNITASEADWVSKIYGLNVYDGFLCCKAYPFLLSSVAGTQDDALMYNRILISPFQLVKATSNIINFDLGSVTLDIRQAWEIESTDYSIYLPYAGVFPLDVRSGAEISVKLSVDLYSGVGEYTIYQDEQCTALHKAILGTDIPLNLNQGIMNSNLLSNITSAVTSGLPLLAGALGGPAAAGVAGLVSSAANNLIVQHDQINAPQVGGATTSYCYPFVRILAKVPKMFGDAVGFSEILGENRSFTYQRLKACAGFTQTKNYKCDIIVATDEEKQEIERLMNGGVFL